MDQTANESDTEITLMNLRHLPSGSGIRDSRFRIPDSEFRIRDPGLGIRDARIPKAAGAVSKTNRMSGGCGGFEP